LPLRHAKKRSRAIILAAFASGLAGCAVQPQPVAVEASVPVASASLMGASTTRLTALLGHPKLRRIDGRAQVWLYDSRLCRLNLILYPGTSGTPLVTLASPSPPSVSAASCLASLENRASS
jgi:hypothetical protein